MEAETEIILTQFCMEWSTTAASSPRISAYRKVIHRFKTSGRDLWPEVNCVVLT